MTGESSQGTVGRRRVLAVLGAVALGALARRASAGPDDTPDFAVKDLEIDDPDRGRREDGDASPVGRLRYTLLVPKHLAPGERAPLLVLLHGLGETGDARLGARAWLDRYGLGTSYSRLVRAKTAFKGLVVACPYVPNVGRAADPRAAFDRYARSVVDRLVPHARAEAGDVVDPARTTLDGCSLGGLVGLEVFTRRPDAFGAWGGVQSAFGVHRAAGFAARLADAAGTRRLHVETSSADPFRDANRALAKALTARGAACDFLELPGPHDQPWLRASGTIAMLDWHASLA